MGVYKEPVLIDSNPDRALRQLPVRGFWFMVTFVYIPLLILSIGIRVAMLYNNVSIIDLTVVDDFVRELIKIGENLYYFNS
ncbi:MAG: hypothetical protein KDD70_00585 [Bdellovibrionales bacterium]|nr:hypothetical protein [Bdellovibrionales bacterium]